MVNLGVEPGLLGVIERRHMDGRQDFAPPAAIERQDKPPAQVFAIVHRVLLGHLDSSFRRKNFRADADSLSS
jgi:hypothetical protein